MKDFYRGFKLGILGGGQLGKMLIRSAMDFNIACTVMDPDPKAPCSRFANEFQAGDLTDFDQVVEFGRQADLLTIEIENVNCDALEALEKEGRLVRPQSSVLRLIQDKGLQKQFFEEHGIPTSEFELVEGRHDLSRHAGLLPAFLKLRRAGYDGRGVQRLSNAGDFVQAFQAPSVLEREVDFQKEISVIVARNPSGDVRAFPVVELEFHPEEHLVEFLFSPAELDDETAREASRIACTVAEKLGIEGLLAVEMFLDRQGRVLVNELAPRKHNSGHHTIEANLTSQFEQHLRAIFDLPLGSTHALAPAVMVNLLGAPGYDGETRYRGMQEVLQVEGLHLHLYGKFYTRPYRKMGHITIVDPQLSRAKEKARYVKRTLKVVAGG
ncbi:MAG TPA: 5-(carboxyamino)imidazole ribonucleotide synthase [Acidobacteriota bacterium]|nr:5-(carboxyamino)imidazole ribonucleotide synthase [Acidobacteriota bacterium]